MTFSPQRVAISGITQALPCVVSTAQNHNLATGQVVRLHVPPAFGMFPLNNKAFSVTVLTPTSFSIQYTQVPPGLDVDSRNYPAFNAEVNNPQFTAEVLSIGCGPTPITNTAWQINNQSTASKFDDATRNIATTNQPY